MNFSESSMKEINNHFWSILTPHIIILILYILTGFFGNCMVIYIYLRNMKQSTDSRFFIPCLAIADIIASIIGGLSAIVMAIYHVTFTNDLGCKITWFLMTSTTSGAALILVFIAYHRYMKICKPMAHAKLMDRKITVVVFLYFISIIISCPVLVTSGVTQSTYGNNHFYTCDRIQEEYHTGMKFLFAMIYTVFESLVVISIATLLTIMYTKVGLRLFRHFKLTYRSMYGAKGPELEPEPSRDSIASINSQLSGEAPPSNSSGDVKESKSVRIKRKKMKFNQRHKYTYIFIAISVVCIVTYTPRMTLMIIETVNSKFWSKFYNNSHMLAFLKFLNRSYILNNIVNPFLYAMFDPKFKNKLVSIFRCKN